MRVRAMLVVAAVVAILVGEQPASADHQRVEACPPSMWLANPGIWEEYAPTSRVSNMWPMLNLPYAERRLTFIQALADPGRSATASRRLLRAGVTAYLNAAHEGVWYPYRRFSAPYHLRATISAAIASNDASRMAYVARQLETVNNNNRCLLP